MNTLKRLFNPLILLLLSFPLNARSIDDEAVTWLSDFIQVDTVNPPGNEVRAVEFYAKIFEKEGIEYQTAESAPGRGNIWARIKGGDKPGLILLQHTDVVPADPEFWTTEPLSGDIRDGYIWGRGALDMKSTGISQLATFLSLHRAGVPLNRDVVFVASADEEAGGMFGAGWLTKHHPEIFAGAGSLITEGGAGVSTEGEPVFSIEVTQKVPVWLRLNAIDVPGHGSSPRASSSTTRIVEALNILRENPFEPRVVPAVSAYFLARSKDVGDEWKKHYSDLADAVKDPEFLSALQASSPRDHALTRDTCSITRFQGSSKINVVPPQAWAEIDCRILPDRPSEVFVSELREMIKDTGVEIEVLMAFTPAVSSTTSELYRVIQRVIGERYPESSIIPSVATGFTDSHFARDLGIDSYGFSPAIHDRAEFVGVHGNDERIDLVAFKQGVIDHLAIISEFVYK